MTTIRNLLALTVLTLAATLVAAATPDQSLPPRPMTPMLTEISAVAAASQDAVAALNRSLQTTDPAARLTLQKEIARVKQEAHIEILTIQLRYAEAEGRSDTAASLRRSLEALTAPRVTGTPVRSAPQPAAGR